MVSQYKSRAVEYGLFLLAIFVAADLSIYLTRLSSGVAIIWLPNALCVAVFIARRITRPWPFLALHALAITLANSSFGDPIFLAAKLGLANMAAAFVLTHLYWRVLPGTARPHDSDANYRRFLVRVAMPSSIVGAVLGAWTITQEYGVPYLSVFFNWTIGDAVSSIVFLPLFLLIFDHPLRHWFAPLDLTWTALIGVLLAATTVASHFVGDQILPLALAGPILAMAAAFVQTRGVIVLTALHLLGLFAGTLFDKAYLTQQFPDVETLILLAAIFLCVAIPANVIASMVAHLHEARHTAEKAIRVKEQFLSTMSHELRTPLNTISGMFQLLMTTDLAPRHKAWVQAGQDSTHHLDRLVGDLFLSAVGQEHTIQITPEALSVKDIAEQSRHILEAEIRASGKSLRMQVNVAADIPEQILADDLRVHQVISNMFNNAVKYSTAGDIHLSLTSRKGWLAFSVQDQGLGIAQADLPFVFDRFWQAESGAARRHDGAGLGLYVARELARAMGGDLTVHSTLGTGSTFVLTLRPASGATTQIPSPQVSAKSPSTLNLAT